MRAQTININNVYVCTARMDIGRTKRSFFIITTTTITYIHAHIEHWERDRDHLTFRFIKWFRNVCCFFVCVLLSFPCRLFFSRLMVFFLLLVLYFVLVSFLFSVNENTRLDMHCAYETVFCALIVARMKRAVYEFDMQKSHLLG